MRATLLVVLLADSARHTGKVRIVLRCCGGRRQDMREPGDFALQKVESGLGSWTEANQ